MPIYQVENHDVRIINLGECEDKGKAKVVEVETLTVKKTYKVEPTTKQDEDMEEEVESSKASKVRNNKKQKAHFHRRIELDDFPLGKGTKSYDLIADVRSQGPKISWPQLLHLSPTMR